MRPLQVLIWIIGSTVKATAFAATASEGQLWGMAVIHVLQLAFIIVQYPFNDRLENIVQGVVTLEQGLFFAVMAFYSSAEDTKDAIAASGVGGVLNILNLAAMGVLVVASVKTQVFGIRKLVLKTKKNLVATGSCVGKAMVDPRKCPHSIYECFYGKPKDPLDLCPFTDSVALDPYVHRFHYAPLSPVLDGDLRDAMIEAAEKVWISVCYIEPLLSYITVVYWCSQSHLSIRGIVGKLCIHWTENVLHLNTY